MNATSADHEVADAQLDEQVHSLCASLQFSDAKLNAIRDETSHDPALQTFTTTIQVGWPQTCSEVQGDVVPYWNYRESLTLVTVIDGIVFKGEKIVVPNVLHPNILKQLHQGHLGMELTKRRSRDILFWPGMNSQIENS